MLPFEGGQGDLHDWSGAVKGRAAGGICRLSGKHTFYSVWSGKLAEDFEDKSEVICL